MYDLMTVFSLSSCCAAETNLFESLAAIKLEQRLNLRKASIISDIPELFTLGQAHLINQPLNIRFQRLR